MKIEIKHCYTENVLYTCDAENLSSAVIEAVGEKADLSGADLSGADLRGAYLSGAYLCGTDLRGAYLSGAYLCGADLSGEKIAICPILMSGTTWDILISESYLAIGCERHTHDEWRAFTKDEIKEMESRASDFWAANKSWILSACKAHRKESLKFSEALGETK